jgi:hypothetical protein
MPQRTSFHTREQTPLPLVQVREQQLELRRKRIALPPPVWPYHTNEDHNRKQRFNSLQALRPARVREHRPAFRRTVKWRTGSEARISTLERRYGRDRSRLDDLDGARIWTGHGILAHNLVKIATLAA